MRQLRGNEGDGIPVYEVSEVRSELSECLSEVCDVVRDTSEIVS